MWDQGSAALAKYSYLNMLNANQNLELSVKPLEQRLDAHAEGIYCLDVSGDGSNEGHVLNRLTTTTVNREYQLNNIGGSASGTAITPPNMVKSTEKAKPEGRGRRLTIRTEHENENDAALHKSESGDYNDAVKSMSSVRFKDADEDDIAEFEDYEQHRSGQLKDEYGNTVNPRLLITGGAGSKATTETLKIWDAYSLNFLALLDNPTKSSVYSLRIAPSNR